MDRLNIKNKTSLKIPIEKWFEEVKEDAEKIPQDKYPITIIISESEYDEDKKHWKHSRFKPEKGLIEIKVLPNSTLRQIKWSFMHEFRHFMQIHIPELRNATHEDVDVDELKKIISKVFQLNDDDFYEIFHDLYPAESDAIIYATQKSGKNYRKHRLRDMLRQFNLED